ncbi:MarR family transcriptional regulator [Lysinibacillus sp. NPDC056959]|uniref:MarR family transcriptional regulator n=1 Tax=Lysinibacillus sp. NPDC056959 TaxID=3345981 RepID=UPI00362B1900
MGTSASAVSQLVNRLEQESFIKRTMSKKDRRLVIIELDERGILIFKSRRKLSLLLFINIIQSSIERTLLQLKDILSKLHSIISEEQEKNKRS